MAKKPRSCFKNNEIAKNCRTHGRQWSEYADILCAFFLALCPILQHYKGPIVDARATLLVLMSPYLLYKFWKSNEVNLLIALPLIGFTVCKVLFRGITIVGLGREVLLWFYFIAAASKLIDTKRFIRIFISVAAVASILIVIQYISYYIFNCHLQLVPTSLLLKSSETWIGLAETGKISVTGKEMRFYRPSSFFLEPSHMTLYCVPAVLLLLLSPQTDKRRLILAVLITVGVIACTSGMGIVLCVGIWGLYFVFYFREEQGDEPISLGKLRIKGIKTKDLHFKGFTWKKMRVKPFTVKGLHMKPVSLLLLAGMVIVLVLLYLFVDVFRSSINRIFYSPAGSTALEGRTASGIAALAKMNWLDWLCGERKLGEEAGYYMSAFYGTIYDYGVIALVLSYVFYVYSLLKLKRQYRWLALMIMGLSYFTVHTHGSSYMLHLCILLFAGHIAGDTHNPFGRVYQLHPLRLKKKEKTIDE